MPSDFDRAGFIDRLADHVHDAAERAGADRHHDRAAGVGHLAAAHQTLGGVHRDGAHRGFAEMLGDLEHQTVVAVLGFDRIENRGQMSFELHVDDGADDLGDATGLVGRGSHKTLSLKSETLGHDPEKRIPVFGKDHAQLD